MIKKYTQLNLQQKYTIGVSLKEGKTQSEIARLIGCSQSTVSRECRRNRSEKRKTYYYNFAHQLAMERREWTVNNKSYSAKVKERVFSLIREDWSPKHIQGYFAVNGDMEISHQTIYNWIHQDKKEGGDLYTHCRHALKKRKRHISCGSASHIPNRRSIHERPEIKDPLEIGYIEMDTIVAKGGKAAILTLLEKATGFTFMAKLKNGFKPNDLAKEVVRLLFPYRLNIKTITTDNGLEFRAHEYITKRLGIPIYFADPYASWQKGAIEYTNKLIRKYIPKSSDFSEVTTQETRTIIQKLNNRPRKKINFKKPIDCFLMHYR